MDKTGSEVDLISTAEHRPFHFLLSGNWICKRVLGKGIVIENNVSGEEIHLDNNSNGWFTVKQKDEARAFNFHGKREDLFPVLIREK